MTIERNPKPVTAYFLSTNRFSALTSLNEQEISKCRAPARVTTKFICFSKLSPSFSRPALRTTWSTHTVNEATIKCLEGTDIPTVHSLLKELTPRPFRCSICPLGRIRVVVPKEYLRANILHTMFHISASPWPPNPSYTRLFSHPMFRP